MERENSIESRQCRICLADEDESPTVSEKMKSDRLVSPCNCAGSIQWVHRYCLSDWIKKDTGGDSSNSTRCELCGYTYQIALRLRPLSEWTARTILPTSNDWTPFSFDTQAMYRLVTYPLRSTLQQQRRFRRKIPPPEPDRVRQLFLVASALLLAVICFAIYGLSQVARLMRALMKATLLEMVVIDAPRRVAEEGGTR